MRDDEPQVKVYTLEDLVALITPENVHGEMWPAGSVGLEEW